MRGIVGLFFSFLFFSLVHPSIFIDYCRVDCSLWACSSGDQMMLIVPLLLLVPPSLPFLCHGSFRFWPLEVTIYWNDTFWTPFFPPDVFFFISDTYIFFFPIRKSVLPPIEHLNDLFLIYNLIDTSEMKASSDQSIQFGRDMHLITRRRYAILSFPGFFKKSSPFIVSYIYIYIYVFFLC